MLPSSNHPRTEVLQALHRFLQEASNENKMELILCFDAVPEAERRAVLGEELQAAVERIVLQNDHPDDFLQSLLGRFFP